MSQLRSSSISAQTPAPVEPVLTLVESPNPVRASRIRVFPSYFETINVGLGLVLFVLSPLSFFLLDRADYRGFYSPTWGFLFNILLLNITHNAFSFVLPLVSPEVRTWWRTSRHFGLSTNALVGLCFAGMFSILLVLNSLLLSGSYRKEASIAIGVIFLIATTRHGFGQIYGISRLYDQRDREKYGPPSDRNLQLIEWQRKLMKVLLWVGTFRLGFPYFLKNEEAAPFLNSLTVVMVAVVLGIIGLAIAEKRKGPSNKPWYLTRLWTYCFVGFGNPIPFYGTFVLHSFEHTAVTGMMTQNSYKRDQERQIKARRYWGWATFAIGAVVVLVLARDFMYGRQLKEAFPNHWLLIAGMASLSGAMTYCHFLLDEIMFKMKKPEVREHIAPLFQNRD